MLCVLGNATWCRVSSALRNFSAACWAWNPTGSYETRPRSMKSPKRSESSPSMATSSSNATIVSTLMRDGYAVDQFAASGFPGTPLHADDPRQVPFLNAEQQWETRWVVEARLQADETVTGIPQQFAGVLNVTLIDVDAAYPP